MSTSFIFNGKKISLAGVYSAIKSGIRNPAPALDYGKVLIIDTGSGAGFGFGSGVLGTLKNQADAVYSNIKDQGTMKSLMKGGVWWKLAEPLFKPDGRDSIGASEVVWARAAETTPAEIEYAFDFGITNGQTLVTATTVAAGLAAAQVNTITVGAAVDKGDVFSVTKGSTVSYTAVLGDTNITVAAALKALIDASPAFASVTATLLDEVIVLTANAVNTPFTQTSSATNTTDNAGALVIQVRDEGLVGNGTAMLSGTLLTRGYGAILEAGTTDTSKFVMKFYLGAFTGTDPLNSVPYDNTEEVDTTPILVAQSPEISTVTELTTWMTKDTKFNELFKLVSFTAGSDDFTAADLVSSGDLTLAAGGTETYTAAAFDAVLDIVTDYDFSFIISDKFNANAEHLYNSKLQTWMHDESRFDRFLMIGGGDDSSEFESVSIAAAEAYDDQHIHIVHGAPKVASRNAPTGFFTYDSLYKTVMVTGRIAGLPPQVPPTFKGMRYSGEVHTLTKKEQERALSKGVLYTIYDMDLGKYIIGQGINSLQTNDYQINDDGTSYSIQINRIAAQLNKEIIVNAKRQLFGNPNGVNLNTLSEQNVKDWLIGYLRSRIASQTEDNLLIGYDTGSITVRRDQDSYHCTYRFQPNGEINKMFVTGFMIN